MPLKEKSKNIFSSMNVLAQNSAKKILMKISTNQYDRNRLRTFRKFRQNIKKLVSEIFY